MKDMEYVARMEDASNAYCHSLPYTLSPLRFITGINNSHENRLIALTGRYKWDTSAELKAAFE
jgi:hypothetical protein